MGLTLLALALITLKFWDEAFLTVFFIINHLPSKIINDQSPFECLHGKTLDYSCCIAQPKAIQLKKTSIPFQDVCISWV